MPAAWVAAAGAVMGAMNSGSGSSQTTQNSLDPNIVPYLYGNNGLLGNVNNLYQQQNAQGGLNPMQNAGLEMQRQTLMNPQYTMGFDQMRQLGAGLMGQGVAGNPFTQAQTAQALAQPAQMQPQRYQNNGLLNPAMRPLTPNTAAPAAAGGPPSLMTGAIPGQPATPWVPGSPGYDPGFTYTT